MGVVTSEYGPAKITSLHFSASLISDLWPPPRECAAKSSATSNRKTEGAVGSGHSDLEK